MIADFANDISLETARQAHSGTSFTPEKRAEQERDGYAQTLAADYEMLLKYTEGKPGAVETLNAEFARYREGYRQRTIKHLNSKARCLSWMITGPSNFPTARNEKRNRVEHKRCEELIEFRDRALDAIRKTLCPELRPIMAGDSDACQRLQANIEEAEKLQEIMKACNHAIRSQWKNGEQAVIAALVALGRSETLAREMIQPGKFGGMGFASFELTNNGANIRRMKQRLESISRNQATQATEVQGQNARIEDCPADNRVRLFFPGKPDQDTRSRLKSKGFRWSPTIGAWQAYRNSGTIETAKREARL